MYSYVFPTSTLGYSDWEFSRLTGTAYCVHPTLGLRHTTEDKHICPGHRNGTSVFGTITELWKATISFFMSVRPPAWNKSTPTGRMFVKFWYLVIFRTYVEKIRVSLKSEKNYGYFTWILIYVLDQFFLEREMLKEKSCTEKKYWQLQSYWP
jgi:hypothetical protein